MRVDIRFALLAVPLLVTACTVGPNYRVPAAPVPAQWSKTSVAPAAPAAKLAAWWRGFHDPVLDRLVDRAIAGNLDLRLAQARIREARAARVAAAAPLWPSLTGSASGTRFHGRPSPLAGSSSASAGAGGSESGVVTKNLFQADLDSRWELDIFGGTRRGVESADADFAASVEDERASLVSLLGELAIDYINLRRAQTRLQIARNTLAAQENTLSLTQAKFKAGLGSALDVAEADAAAASARAAIPGLQTAVRDAIHEVSVLTGAPPEALASELDHSAPIPAMSGGITLGLPAELLRRRPDIRAAERRVAAANANIGVAVAKEYPSFTLAGSIGLNATQIGDLANVSARGWSFGPSVTLPIFNAGKLAAEVDIKRARWEEAVIAYRATVLAAAREVEDAIAAYDNERAHRATLAQSVAAYRDALALARDLYGRGLASFLHVSAAERSLYAAQDQLARSEAAVSSDIVRLFKALGGGWTPEQAAAEAGAEIRRSAMTRSP